MPVSKAPYKRTYAHTKSRGSNAMVNCGYCGKRVPRYKTFIKTKGFRINDPTLLQQLDKRFIHFGREKMYVCPKCARHHKIVQPGKSVQKKHLRR